MFFGRRFNEAATSDDIVTGAAANEFLVGGLGNDTLYGDVGVELTIGGAGDDILFYDGLDRRVDSGSGADPLRLANSDQALNLHELGMAGHALTNFELSDLSGNGDNAVNLTGLDVLNLSKSGNTL